MKIKTHSNLRLTLFFLSGLTAVITSILLYFYRPITSFVEKSIVLAPGTIFLKLWETLQIIILLNVWIFEVENSNEFLAGKEKLKFKERGPYVYQQNIVNENITFFENGTMTFWPRRYLTFRKDLSVGDHEIDRLIALNIPLLSVSSFLQASSVLTNLGFSALTGTLNSQQFLNLTVSELLFGYDDRLVTLAHKFIPSWINFNRFGILSQFLALDNGVNAITLTTDPKKLPSEQTFSENETSLQYRIYEWNGLSGLKEWGYKKPQTNETIETNTRCNMFGASFEGTVFPKNIDKSIQIKLYGRSFCRPIPFRFAKMVKSTVIGLEGKLYRVDPLFLARPEENPDNHCFRIGGKYLRKGLGPMGTCYYGFPITLSMPHFLYGDPSILEHIDGIKPNLTLHDSSFVLHDDLGIPIEANLKTQINLDIGEIKYIAKAKAFQNLALPLFYVDLKIHEFLPLFKFFVHLAINAALIEMILIIVLAVIGVGLISICFVLYFCTPDKQFCFNNYVRIYYLVSANKNQYD